jgi:hypothetical protein
MIADVRQFLGKGLYTVGEAAFFARVPEGTLRRWLFGAGDLKPIVTPEIETGDSMVSFLDFIQSLSIRNIRVHRGISPRKIREALDVARKHFGMRHPFAMDHTVFQWGQELAICPPATDPNEVRSVIEASGKHRGHLLLRPIVETHLEDLTFDPSTRLAASYTIYNYRDVPIRMRPDHRFGDPLLPSGYSVRAIWDAVEAEGGIEQTASAYGIAIDEVKAAMRLLDHLARKPGAKAA